MSNEILLVSQTEYLVLDNSLPETLFVDRIITESLQSLSDANEVITEAVLVFETEHLVIAEQVKSELLITTEDSAQLLEVSSQGPPGIQGFIGNTGIQGLQGIQGVQGIPGTADLHFHYAQGPAASTWLIAHGLGKFPGVTVIDSSGEEVEGTIQYIDNNNLRLVFSASFSGSAYLN